MSWRGIWQQAPMKRTMLGWKDSLRCRSTSSLNSCKARVFSPAFSTFIRMVLQKLCCQPWGLGGCCKELG